MPLNSDNFDNFSRVRFNNEIEIEGLDTFKKNLEKHFFSQVTVRNFSPSKDVINLVVELDCNLGFLETLHHFKKNTWGNFQSPEYSFSGALQQLKESNDIPIDVEEFSLFLNDTSIIINRIYHQSISQQLENILSEISTHHIHLTKGLSEIPYEIYVPVFEDDLMDNGNTLLIDIQSGNHSEKDYFSFWGIYYFSEDDAVVYDLKNQSIIKGNLQMLNR
ncbi:hypothetical protein [Maribacter sp. 2308TA10-17]|uniref:hypothetical protein n=1 Tax=Maribacter sp. 2308TA10-17 TaxID=3386276 RepID=UPI0039BC56BC